MTRPGGPEGPEKQTKQAKQESQDRSDKPDSSADRPGFRLSLTAPFELASHLADRLAEELYEAPPALSLFETKTPETWGLCAYFETKPDLEALKALLQPVHSPLPELTLAPVETQDWVALVQTGLSPVRAGRFLVHGSHDREKMHKSAACIEIDAGQAFGTAHHGTTRGCLLALDQLFRKRQTRSARTVLDLGTGTGLLAIAAARMLRRPVLASDIDPISVQTAAQNAALNEIAPFVKTVEATGLHHQTLRRSAPYDLLIANILAAPLLALAPDIKKSMRRGGMLVLSGLLQTQSRSLEARYRGQGFTLVKRLPLDEWMTLILRAQ